MKDAARRQKKLAKFEGRLRIAISQEHSSDKIAAAVEKVREAQLSLFKGQREIAKYIQDPSESEQNHLDRLFDRQQEWKSKSTDEIVAEYR